MDAQTRARLDRAGELDQRLRKAQELVKYLHAEIARELDGIEHLARAEAPRWDLIRREWVKSEEED